LTKARLGKSRQVPGGLGRCPKEDMQSVISIYEKSNKSTAIIFIRGVQNVDFLPSSEYHDGVVLSPSVYKF